MIGVPRILSNRKRVEASVQMRSRIVLLAADGMSDKDIAHKLGTAVWINPLQKEIPAIQNQQPCTVNF